VTIADKNLDAGLSHTVSEITRTDGKAGLLLTLDGLLVASLSLLGHGIRGLSLALAVTGAVALVTGVILALMVVRPRLAGGGRMDRSSFLWWATADPEDVDTALGEDLRRSRIQALSRIALRKMRWLRYSGDASLIAVLALAAAMLTR
jgi:hypothetical protein